MMACPSLDQETAYLAALASTATFQITGEELVLSDAAGEAVLVFAPRRNASLEGTTWQLTGLHTGTAFASLLADTAITATFAEGTVNGSAGCNSYFGSYSADGSHLAIGTVGSTEMFCGEPAGIMDQEQAYLGALASASSAQIEGNVLTLSDADGLRLLTFVAAEA
jgi:heat shock protein HslJ